MKYNLSKFRFRFLKLQNNVEFRRNTIFQIVNSLNDIL